MNSVTPSLSLYEESTVVVWGTGINGGSMVCWLQQLGIHVVACCDNKEDKWGTVFYGVPVISPKELAQWQEEKGNLLVQLALNGINMPPVVAQLDTFNIKNYVTFAEGVLAIESPLEEKLIQLYPTLQEEIHRSVEKQHRQIRSEHDKFKHAEGKGLYVISPRKTGDITVVRTCQREQIPIVFGFHTPNQLRGIKEKKHPMQVITGVRDPIARDISDIFQIINSDTISFLSCCTPEEGNAFIHEKKVQGFFDHYVENNYLKQETKYSTIYSRFFENLASHVMDIKAKPWNQEQGYTIVTEDHVSLFLYQLERLNDIVTPLSQWLGTPFDTLENANIASEKWIAPYYAAAKENLRFSQAYVDAAYDDVYVKAIYSPEQIQKMKSKWAKNIR